MSPMFENRHAQDTDGTGAGSTDTAGGFLEDTGGLIQGPYGPVARLGPAVVPPEQHWLDTVPWRRYRPRYLIWTDTAARALLGGALVTDLLGTKYVLLDGKHRPVWHPCPGVDAPDLAVFSQPPDNISATDLMVRLVAATRR